MAVVSRSVAAVGEEMFGIAKCGVALFIYQCSKMQQSAGGCAFFDISMAVFEHEAVRRADFLKGGFTRFHFKYVCMLNSPCVTGHNLRDGQGAASNSKSQSLANLKRDEGGFAPNNVLRVVSMHHALGGIKVGKALTTADEADRWAAGNVPHPIAPLGRKWTEADDTLNITVNHG